MGDKVNSIVRVLRILECFTNIKNTWSLKELSEELDLSLTTVHRQLATLVSEGYINHDKVRKTYSVGNRLILMSCSAVGRYDIRNAAMPHIEKLSKTVGETIHLCQLDGHKMFYVEKVESQLSVSCNSSIGSRVPAHFSASGKVLLSEQTPGYIDAYCHDLDATPAYTKNSITTERHLRDELDKTRKQGYARDDEETEIGLLCIAAPIYNMDRECIAAVSISGPRFRIKDNIDDFIPLLQNCTGEISKMIGFA
jgi:DNA-binding IclR family transcriptional regulator